MNLEQLKRKHNHLLTVILASTRSVIEHQCIASALSAEMKAICVPKIFAQREGQIQTKNMEYRDFQRQLRRE